MRKRFPGLTNIHIFSFTPMGCFLKYEYTDAEARKRGEQTGLDTLVVHALNDECQTSGSMLFGVTPNGLSIPPGEYGRKVKTQRN